MCDSGVVHCQSQHQYHFWRRDVRSVLHGQVSLAAVNQICVIHEAMKYERLQKSKDLLKDGFENVNILHMPLWVVIHILYKR